MADNYMNEEYRKGDNFKTAMKELNFRIRIQEDIQRILELRFYYEGLQKKTTLKEIFMQLLFRLWESGEHFNPKRPFDSSYDWINPFVACLIANDILEGTIDDEDSTVKEVEWLYVDYIVTTAIEHIFSGVEE